MYYGNTFLSEYITEQFVYILNTVRSIYFDKRHSTKSNLFCLNFKTISVWTLKINLQENMMNYKYESQENLVVWG